MRILFLSSADAPDYQCDMLFHGLRHLEGADVVDYRRLWYMYSAEFEADPYKKRQLYGNGFSIYGLLHDGQTDRDDVERKIRFRYYDLVIYGSVWRCHLFWDLVTASYPPNRIVLVDGEDRTVVHNRHTHGVYFKRELTKWLPGIHPIQLCIPREKVAAAGTITLEKKSPVAFMDPRDPLTYIYETEDKYYKGYQTSLFGITTKKAGWDSLRHYEIMANACIPWFLDIEQCPAPTMAFFPKYEMYRIKELIERKGPEYFVGGPGRQLWELTQTTLQARLLSSCTTEAVARYVLDVASQGMGTGLKPGYLRRLTMAGIFGAASAASMLRRMIRSR